MLTPHATRLLARLGKIAQRGPLLAVGHGSSAVGMTLLDALGVGYSSSAKPNFDGIVVTARRGMAGVPATRVNLFARVPDWRQSNCKSSGEIARKYGYAISPDVRRLYCTVRARNPNSQGLFLTVNRRARVLDEMVKTSSGADNVVRWPLNDLEQRLIQTHPESMWVSAIVVQRGGHEYFHFRKATYTGRPFVDRFVTLLEEGTVTVDHLIETTNGSTREKGPLFKIAPSNIPMLFPTSLEFDLLAVNPSSMPPFVE
jgi:hypothetical protein